MIEEDVSLKRRLTDLHYLKEKAIDTLMAIITMSEQCESQKSDKGR